MMEQKRSNCPFRYFIFPLAVACVVGILSTCVAMHKRIRLEDRLNRAADLHRMGDHKKATDAWQAAIDAGGDPVTCLERKADAQFHAKDYAGACLSCIQITKIMPDNARAEYILGLVADVRKDRQNALRHYQSALMRGEKHAAGRIARLGNRQ